MKTISPKTTPKSNTKAALNPFIILVSSNIKKTGPIIKLKNIPQGIPDKISFIIKIIIKICKKVDTNFTN